MRIPIYQVDAFTDRPFAGNPAAVCPLERWLPDPTLQHIANEMNLSETAFFVRDDGDCVLRWFTPKLEVDLCGHATLAAAKVIFEHLRPELRETRFQTRSGELSVKRLDDGLLELDFPSQPGEGCNAHPDLVDALGAAPAEIQRSVLYYLAVFDSEQEVLALRPDEDGLMEIDRIGVVATAPGADGIDFVSRFFAPQAGVYEDPVTGSAHCVLTPYWSARLERSTLRARQVSRRGGDLRCTLRGDRVGIAGHAVLVLEGEFLLADDDVAPRPETDQA